MKPIELLSLQSEILAWCEQSLSQKYSSGMISLKVETMRIIGELNRELYGR